MPTQTPGARSGRSTSRQCYRIVGKLGKLQSPTTYVETRKKVLKRRYDLKDYCSPGNGLPLGTNCVSRFPKHSIWSKKQSLNSIILVSSPNFNSLGHTILMCSNQKRPKELSWWAFGFQWVSSHVYVIGTLGSWLELVHTGAHVHTRTGGSSFPPVLLCKREVRRKNSSNVKNSVGTA